MLKKLFMLKIVREWLIWFVLRGSYLSLGNIHRFCFWARYFVCVLVLRDASLIWGLGFSSGSWIYSLIRFTSEAIILRIFGLSWGFYNFFLDCVVTSLLLQNWLGQLILDLRRLTRFTLYAIWLLYLVINDCWLIVLTYWTVLKLVCHWLAIVTPKIEWLLSAAVDSISNLIFIKLLVL